MGSEGFEPPKRVQQIYSLPPLTTWVTALNISWLEVSNPRPADYKSAALPTELSQQNFINYLLPIICIYLINLIIFYYSLWGLYGD